MNAPCIGGQDTAIAGLQAHCASTLRGSTWCGYKVPYGINNMQAEWETETECSVEDTKGLGIDSKEMGNLEDLHNLKISLIQDILKVCIRYIEISKNTSLAMDKLFSPPYYKGGVLF